MAYGERYIANWAAKGKTGTLTILQKDYVGDADTVKLHNDAIVITKEFDNWESHIIGDICEFSIVNYNQNYFDLFDLMIAKELKYKVVVECNYLSENYILFDGYINTEVVVQKYLRFSTINLVASSYLSKLENVYPDSIDTELTALSIIDIINEILNQIGNTYPIRVCSFLRSDEYTMYESGKSFANRNGLYNEVFWENNVDRVNSLVILEEI